MLESIRHYAVRGVSAAGGAIVFVLTIPIVFAAMVIMMFAGIVALANIRHHLRKARAGELRQSTSDQSMGSSGDSSGGNGRHKPPIEGSYTVLQD